MKEPETVLFETSPFGVIDAMVEQDDRAAYLYLHSRQIPSFGTKALWIRNLIRGPLVLSDEDMQMGIPPVLPRTYCSDLDGGQRLQEERLKLIWFEECNGVALLEDDDIIGIIPPWSGFDGFHGYARDCRTENQICWPLPQKAHLTTRIRRASQYWALWESNQPFRTEQPRLIGALEPYLGAADRYFSINGNQWPPRGLQQFKNEHGSTLSSIGMSLCSMPNVELSVDNPAAIRRVELAFQWPTDDLAVMESCGPWLSGASSYPWRHLTWLGHGHTFPLLDDVRQKVGEEYVAAALIDNRVLKNAIDLGAFHDDPINLIWFVLIRQTELEQIQADNENGFENVFEQLVREDRLPKLQLP